MIEKGANPFIMSHKHEDQYTMWNLTKSKLSKLPKKKSVYFTIRPFLAEFGNNDEFLEPWFHRTGIFGKFDSVIGRGSSGVVLSGDWFGKRAAFKFVGIGRETFKVKIEDGLDLLNQKLSEMTMIQSTKGSKIIKFYGHYRSVNFFIHVQEPTFRQQLHVDDDHHLAGFLGFDIGEISKLEKKLAEFEGKHNLNSETEDMKAVYRQLDWQKIKKYDIFVTELCDGNLSKADKTFTFEQSVDICKQLFEGLEQLETSNKCHNDLKPENILFKASRESCLKAEEKITIKIGDFGTADRSGGTPGWTWPRFLSERQPGRSDMYSTGLMVLYIMCESRDLFYRLRDNYIDPDQEWLEKFRTEEPIIAFVIEMMNLKLSVKAARRKWDKISGQIDFIKRGLLTSPENSARVPSKYLDVQDNMYSCCAVNTTFLDK